MPSQRRRTRLPDRRAGGAAPARGFFDWTPWGDLIGGSARLQGQCLGVERGKPTRHRLRRFGPRFLRFRLLSLSPYFRQPGGFEGLGFLMIEVDLDPGWGERRSHPGCRPHKRREWSPRSPPTSPGQYLAASGEGRERPGTTPEGGGMEFPTKHRAEAKSKPMPGGRLGGEEAHTPPRSLPTPPTPTVRRLRGPRPDPRTSPYGPASRCQR